ncbi:MAG: hypothetical protein WCM76_14210 [Bacteroidota bacterium]
MITKKCENCGKDFYAQRNDARYCSSTCRSTVWQSNKAANGETEQFRNQLKGLVEKAPVPVKKTIFESVPNKEYNSILGKLVLKNDYVKRLLQQKQTFIHQLNLLSNPGNGGITLTSTGAGAYIGYIIPNSNKYDEKKCRKNAAIGGFLGLIVGGIGELFTKDKRDRNRKAEIDKTNVYLDELNVKLSSANVEVNDLKALLGKTQRLLTIEKEVIEEPVINEVIQLDYPTNTVNEGHEINVCKQIAVPAETFVNGNANSKIISSADLAALDYPALNFTGRWRHIFGLPSVNFHCALHGMAGEGKSTFALQLSYYLAENFGPVIYVSGEEGFSKTMKDKIVNNNAISDNLCLADLRTYADLVNEVKPQTYNFIVIDSLDNMRIGALELKELRKLYMDSALITISQSTKNGKIRGSYEVVHDCDIEINVENGVAITEKNRFGERGRTFQVFAANKPDAMMPQITNKV